MLLTTAKGGGVRVSMRSRSDKVDVGKVCMSLGGGGHPGAGGCHLNGDLVTTKEKVVRALDAAFNKRSSEPVLGRTSRDVRAATSPIRPPTVDPDRDPST